jgi:ribosomal-protein-alanine N-acetyltransferase
MGCAEASLREYREDDLEAMFHLDEACFAAEFRFDRRSMRVFAEERGSISLIAEDAVGELIGFVIVHVERAGAGWRGYVVTLDVAEECRRLGLAARMLRAAEVGVFAAGARWMELHVFTGNEGAIRFYERMGYQRIAVRQKFYGKAGLDAFAYRKDLADSQHPEL